MMCTASGREGHRRSGPSRNWPLEGLLDISIKYLASYKNCSFPIKHLQELQLKHYVLLCRGHELPTLVMIAINIAAYHNYFMSII